MHISGYFNFPFGLTKFSYTIIDLMMLKSPIISTPVPTSKPELVYLVPDELL